MVQPYKRKHLWEVGDSDPPLFPDGVISRCDCRDGERDNNTATSKSSQKREDSTANDDSSDESNRQSSEPKLRMTKMTYDEVMRDLVQAPFRHEQGGILIGPRDAQDLAVRYVKDTRGEATYASFSVDSGSLNLVIRQVRAEGMTCVGIIHSHPDGFDRPSEGDFQFLEKIFSDPRNGSGNGYFLFPIVTNGKLFPFVVDTRNVRRAFLAALVLV